MLVTRLTSAGELRRDGSLLRVCNRLLVVYFFLAVYLHLVDAAPHLWVTCQTETGECAWDLWSRVAVRGRVRVSEDEE